MTDSEITWYLVGFATVGCLFGVYIEILLSSHWKEWKRIKELERIDDLHHSILDATDWFPKKK